MKTIPDIEPDSYYHGPIVLTCKKCGHPREHPPFESHINLGGQTNAHCGKCGRVHPHRIGVPEVLEVVPRSKARS